MIAGAYLEAIVLTEVTPEMDAYYEEIFGPVVLVFRAETEEQAIAIANDSPFGLGASVWGTDPDRGRRVAEQIEAGMVYLNSAGGSQADLPFGDIKRSGMGPRTGPRGHRGIHEQEVHPPIAPIPAGLCDAQ